MHHLLLHLTLTLTRYMFIKKHVYCSKRAENDNRNECPFPGDLFIGTRMLTPILRYQLSFH